MPDTVFVRGSGGALFELDVPAGGMALERHQEEIGRGELVIVPEAHWVEGADGVRTLVDGPAPAPAKPSKSEG